MRGEFVKARAMSGPWQNDIQFLIKQKLDKNIYYCSDIIMTIAEEGKIVDPSFKMERHNAQILMDDLWHAGLRPTEGSGSAGSLAATERHLADMRAIVFEHRKFMPNFNK